MKKMSVLLAALIVAGLMVSVAVAKPEGQSGKSNTAHAYLYEMTDMTEMMVIVEDGAWGKIKYQLEGPTFDFVFNGHGLEPNTEYSLVYTDSDGNETVIAEGESDDEGNIHLAGSVELDTNLDEIQLVLSEVPSDVLSSDDISNTLIGYISYIDSDKSS